MMAVLNPIRERSLELMSKPEQVWDILRGGAEHCRKIATATVQEVKKAMGLL